MSDDGIRWCKKRRSDEEPAASYTLLPIYHRSDSSKCSKRSCKASMRSVRQHRNRINRDISNVRRTCSDDFEQLYDHSCTQSSSSSSLRRRRSYRLLNICLMLTLHLISNGFVTRVNCDDLLEAVGARGHFTHTWAVHIPGGADVAEKVADDHGMYMRGKVSDAPNKITTHRNARQEFIRERLLMLTILCELFCLTFFLLVTYVWSDNLLIPGWFH